MAGKKYAQWVSDLNKIVEKLPKEQFSKVIRAIALSALNSIVLRSPVGNASLWANPAPPGYVGGHFRNNWFVDINNVSPQIREEVSKSGSSSLAQSRNLSGLEQDPYVKIYIHNSLPYARRLEYGWSKQAPAGMVSVTLQSLAGIAKV